LKNLPGVLKINNPSKSVNGRKEKIDKTALRQAVGFANVSTASIGRFDKQLPGQKPVKKKAKFLPEDRKQEKDVSLTLLDRVLKKKEQPANVEKAVKSVIKEEQRENTRKKRKFEEDKTAKKKIKKFTKKKKIK